MRFTKMHGIGNDYIYVNCMENELENPSDIAVKMSPRHFSVGSDGLIMICRSTVADAKMRMFNADGSEGKMCGNGIRCVGKYLYDYGITDKTEISVETLGGIKHLSLNVKNGRVESVKVDMGCAVIKPELIPMSVQGESFISQPVEVNGRMWSMTGVSMGNPHAVIFTEGIKELDLEKEGGYFENHPLFPERVNTEFVEVVSRNELNMRVWERGSGESYACGTGACATVTAAVLNGICDYDTPVKVNLTGGQLSVICTKDLRVYMTGTATKVYEGVYEYAD
ncbi:MAG: diaminopimelate epimerase [Clostridia bacterium]|nr:diaminopimelate epimerase [Clostridia bacterium]